MTIPIDDPIYDHPNTHTLGDLNSGDSFEFYPGGPRFTAHPDVKGEDEYVSVALKGEIGRRYKASSVVFYVIPAVKLR